MITDLRKYLEIGDPMCLGDEDVGSPIRNFYKELGAGGGCRYRSSEPSDGG